MGEIGEKAFLEMPGIRIRIEKALEEGGPMTTAEILRRFRPSYPEAVVRMALRFLDDDGIVTRPSQKQRWKLERSGG